MNIQIALMYKASPKESRSRRFQVCIRAPKVYKDKKIDRTNKTIDRYIDQIQTKKKRRSLKGQHKTAAERLDWFDA